VKRQVIVSTAKGDSSIDLSVINRKVDRLKQDLIIHAYNNSFIEKNLDTIISPEDVLRYYDNHKQSFILKEKFIKGYFIQISNTNTQLNFIKSLFYRSDTKSVKKFQELAQAEAINYYFSLNHWEKLNALLVNTPFFQDKKNVESIIRNKQLIRKINDKTFFFKITDMKSEGEISPIDIQRETIKNILLNQRKQKVIKELSENLYKQATKNRAYKIY